jgi:hypothetical protein
MLLFMSIGMFGIVIWPIPFYSCSPSVWLSSSPCLNEHLSPYLHCPSVLKWIIKWIKILLTLWEVFALNSFEFCIDSISIVLLIKLSIHLHWSFSLLELSLIVWSRLSIAVLWLVSSTLLKVSTLLEVASHATILSSSHSLIHTHVSWFAKISSSHLVLLVTILPLLWLHSYRQ